MYDKNKPGPEECRTASERQALANLLALLEESDPTDLIDTIDIESLLKQIFWSKANLEVTHGVTHAKPFGTFPCGSCAYCRYMDTRKNIQLPNGWRFNLKHFANCQTMGVVYPLQCGCGCYYIGKTI